MDQKYINLFDRFTHGGMNRREFMEKLSILAGSTTAATAILPILENNYAHADILPEGDPRIVSETLTYAGGAGYFAKPSAEGKYPGVIVIHENRGLNPHIKDVARRMAAEGFAALAPDYLSDLGGTPEDADKARDMIGTLKPEGIDASSSAALATLKANPASNGKAGAMGFCWGGGKVNSLAVADQGLGAGVAYYGSQPAEADVPKITAPLLLHYASLDERINAGIPAFEAALKANNKVYELHMYEGANHAFNNDTNAARFNKDAAELAWSRTVAFLKKHVS
ncbi:MAG TPA: dienelactone hydrolase family protein [Aestuariivirga sp.]|jgi:carboxymethylenebutenolidase|nr:dienelactone hydrolase family protein [Aestuariivirga sp.]